MARTCARRPKESLGAQYAALAGYVVIEAVIFVPMLVFANATAPGVISSAAIVSLLGFGGLTAIVFTNRKDFSFMGGMLKWMGILALVAIGASLLFGAHLGTWFSVAMIGLAGASILYDTSNVLHHYPRGPLRRGVAVALRVGRASLLVRAPPLLVFGRLNRADGATPPRSMSSYARGFC